MLKKKNNPFSKRAALLFNLFRYPMLFLWIGLRQKKFLRHVRYLMKLVGEQLYGTVFRLKQSLIALEALPSDYTAGGFDDEHLAKIHRKSLSLHATLPKAKNYFYSFIVVLDGRANPAKQLLESMLLQTAERMEILVGCNRQRAPEIFNIVAELEKRHPSVLRMVDFPAQSISRSLNQLAALAKGNVLMFADAEAWLRPDLLYRYEQTMLLLDNPELYLLYSSEYILNETGALSLQFGYSSSQDFQLPYVFSTQAPACFLLFKNAWEKLEGLRESFEGVHFYDLILRFASCGEKIKKICLPLCARRQKPAGHSSQKDQSTIDALSEFANRWNLRWKIQQGIVPNTLRAIPELDGTPLVHAVIPYKDQKEMTIAAIKSLKAQSGVVVRITAVDNRSEDKDMAGELEKMGVEVIRIDEPFNFSRLNNLAIARSQAGKDCPLVFFMNNDVELHEGALLEMCRWIGQPDIGIVGCRLSYPNGQLQCGGIDLDDELASWQMVYRMTETKLSYEKLDLQLRLRIADAVTGAATLVKKTTFLDVGGFDEVWYPITFSDVNLIEKIKKKGLKAFYTPYASGIHHESISRTVNFVEDYETSFWLHRHYFEHVFPKLSISFFNDH